MTSFKYFCMKDSKDIVELIHEAEWLLAGNINEQDMKTILENIIICLKVLAEGYAHEKR